jgi:hypothetical protein
MDLFYVLIKLSLRLMVMRSDDDFLEKSDSNAAAL